MAGPDEYVAALAALAEAFAGPWSSSAGQDEHRVVQRAPLGASVTAVDAAEVGAQASGA